MGPNPKREAMRETLLALIDIGDRVENELEGEPPPHMPSWHELTRTCTQQAQLRQLQRDYLVRWTESVGVAVEKFWQEVDRAGLDVPRKKDVVLDTLARGRVLGPDQFYELEDHFEELQTCGKITAEQADALNEMLDRFEADEDNFDKVL